MNNHHSSISIQQREKLIKDHPFFAFLAPEDISELSELMQIHHANNGDVIVNEGDLIDKVYLIAEGEAEVTKTIATKERTKVFPIATLIPGEIIGLSEEGLFAKEGHRTAKVSAIRDSLLLTLTIAQLDQFINKHAHLYPGFKKSLEILLRMNFIKKSVPFSHLSFDAIKSLAAKLEKQSIHSGSIIFNQDDMGDKAYLIESGTVEIEKQDLKNSTSRKILLKSPDIFGEIALMNAAPRTATAKAIEDVELLAISHELLMDILRHNKKVAAALEALIKDRTALDKKENILMATDKTLDNDSITRLSSKDHHLLNLSGQGAFIWSQIDGKKSIADIIAVCNQEFNLESTQIVEDTILQLINVGFITTASSSRKKHYTLWDRIKQIVSK